MKNSAKIFVILMKKLFSIVSKLSAKRFGEFHSDWPKLLFGSHALVRGHRNLKCVPALVLRAGSAFLLLQFLFIAFSITFTHTPTVCQ